MTEASSAAVQDAALCELLTGTLELWGVAGAVERGAGALAATVRAERGTLVWIERIADESVPFRWAVRWRPTDAAAGGPRELRPRLCGSLVGVLAALRSALGVERGTAVRIAAQ